MCAEERLDRAVTRGRLVLERESGERHLLGEPRAQVRGEVGHRVPPVGSAGLPGPGLSGAIPRLAGCFESVVEKIEVHRARLYGGSLDSAPIALSPSAMRLAKHLAHAGVASRRASEQLVFDGRVLVDGEVITDPARDVSGEERIQVDGENIGGAPSVRVVYALNKPPGVVSTASDTHGRPTVVDLVRAPGDRRLYPIGRLDAETTGLILLTDDGDLAHRMTHPSFGVPKTYVAHVGGKRVSDGALRRLAQGR